MDHQLKSTDIIRILAFSALFGLARAVFCSLWRNNSLIPESRVFIRSAVLCAVFTLLLFVLIQWMKKHYAEKGAFYSAPAAELPSVSRKHFFTLFLLVYTVALLAWFPGTTYYDTLMIYFNRMTMMTQFPPIYCLWITALADLGRALHYPRLTMILLSVIQILLVSAMMAQVCHWFWRKRIPSVLKFAAILFCTLNPLYSMYAISAIKDTVSSLALVVMVTVLYDMAAEGGEEQKENWLIFALCMIFPLALRSNGIFIVLVLLFVMLVRFRNFRRQVLLLFLEFLFLKVAERILYWRFDTRPFLQEALAIPIQQLCAVVAWNGRLTAEQASFIHALLPLDVIREVYNPSIVDPVKWNTEFSGSFLQANLSGFFKTWFDVMLSNFWIYVKAYLLQTLGYWAPANLATTEIFTAIEGLHRSYLAENFLVTAPVWGEGPLQAVLEKYYRSAIRFPSEGIWIWLMFFCCFFRSLMKKDKQSLLIFSPCLLCWITLMLAAPVYTGTRYALPFLYGIPVFFLLAIL